MDDFRLVLLWLTPAFLALFMIRLIFKSFIKSNSESKGGLVEAEGEKTQEIEGIIGLIIFFPILTWLLLEGYEWGYKELYPSIGYYHKMTVVDFYILFYILFFLFVIFIMYKAFRMKKAALILLGFIIFGVGGFVLFHLFIEIIVPFILVAVEKIKNFLQGLLILLIAIVLLGLLVVGLVNYVNMISEIGKKDLK